MVRRIRRTVKRCVNRHSCTCKREVCFVIELWCMVLCVLSQGSRVYLKLESSKTLPCALSIPEVPEVQLRCTQKDL